MTKTALIILGLMHITSIQSTPSIKFLAIRNGTQPFITVNNQTDATVFVNDKDYSTAQDIFDIHSIEVKAPDGSIIKQFNQGEITDIHTITISKSAETDDYLIETEKKVDHVNLTINNYSDDTIVLLNGRATIRPSCKNIEVTGVKNVLIRKIDDTHIQLFSLSDLQNVTIVNITKDPITGKYEVST